MIIRYHLSHSHKYHDLRLSGKCQEENSYTYIVPLFREPAKLLYSFHKFVLRLRFEEYVESVMKTFDYG